MRILVGMEASGVIREAFRERGCDAWSNDLVPAADGSPYHLQMDVFEALRLRKWDIAILHPMCTYLTVSANGAFKGPNGFCKNGNKRGPWRYEELEKAVKFAKDLWETCEEVGVEEVAVENPVGRLSTLWMPPTQVIQPHMFGSPKFKGTCLWLKNLPPLKPTNQLKVPDKKTDPDEFKRWSEVHMMPPGPDRWRKRSETDPCIAAAMADQWR